LAQLGRDLAQRVQPRRIDAVVIGEEDAHRGNLSAEPAYARTDLGAIPIGIAE